MAPSPAFGGTTPDVALRGIFGGASANERLSYISKWQTNTYNFLAGWCRFTCLFKDCSNSLHSYLSFWLWRNRNWNRNFAFANSVNFRYFMFPQETDLWKHYNSFSNSRKTCEKKVSCAHCGMKVKFSPASMKAHLITCQSYQKVDYYIHFEK